MRGNHGGHDDVNLDASYDFDSDIDVAFDLDVDVNVDIDFSSDIDVCVDIHGNEATFQIDLQAFGDDSAVDLNLVVVTNDDWASITATGYAATA